MMMRENEIKVFNNSDLGIQTRTRFNLDGSISINAEDTAIGYGWVQVQNKNGKKYTSVRWETLNAYCKEMGFPNILGKGDYIPEPLFYRLGMKASNMRAQRFQNWLAFDVLPSIREFGMYVENGNKISLKEQIEAIALTADILNVNEASKVYMIGKHFKSYNLPTDFLPNYVSNGNRQYKSATQLLKDYDINISTVKWNQLLIDNGYLEEKERKSTSSKTGKKKYKALTDKGLQYGENLINPNNQKEVQPNYYVDTFKELCEKVIK